MLSKGVNQWKRHFFLQYHYMPFLVAAMIIPYYIPYIIHRTVNRDLINLKNAIKEDDVDADRLTKYFFSVFRHPTLKSCWLVICNIIIKILYIAVNVGVFLCLDYILNNKFRYYGNDWLEWGKLDNPVQHDYTSRLRNFPTPGNQLLPSFGYCEVANSAKDIKESTGNYHKVVCEISQHVLYQYTLLVLWVAILCGIIISVLRFGLHDLVLSLPYLHQSTIQITSWCSQRSLYARIGIFGFHSPKERHVVRRCHRKIEKNLK
ncbi:uncharacterized protein [Clytia hemisphaerica]|uniref:Innexin n=1 Tax=Clytia hemisphaerica TaxID=252671 RepID=A0A7M5UWX6_9CNID